MTPDEIREARLTLGLSRAQLARLLDLGRAQDVQRMEMPVTAATHRPMPVRAERLLRAYLAGYRPDDWPGEAAP